jgi:hypothetical protein
LRTESLLKKEPTDYQRVIAHREMIKMRNGWEKGGIQSLQGNSLSHSPQHKVSDDQARSQYDFGLSTADRSVSAPPPSEMGFEVSCCASINK